MSKPRKYVNKILKLVSKKPITNPKISKQLGIHRKIVRDNLIWMARENLTYSDELGKYHLTPLGKLCIDSSVTPPDSVSFNVASQIIDSLKIRQEIPNAKCTIQMEDAKKIKKLDDKTIYFERFITHDGLGLSDNNTYLKQAVAEVVDVILDFRAKEKGALTVLDQQLRDKVTVFNMDTYYSAFDYKKRYEDLAAVDFEVLIEFKGKKWVESQNFNDLENTLETRKEFSKQISREINVTDQRIRHNKAIYGIMGGSGRPISEKSLHTNRLFNSEKKLKDLIHNWFRLYQVEGQLQIEDIIQKGFESGFFEIEKKEFYHLKLNKTNKSQFFDSISLKGLNETCPSIAENIQDESKNQDSEADNILGNIDDIVSRISKESEFFEKTFLDLLTKLIERYEKAKLYDNVIDTSQIRNGIQPSHLIAAEKSIFQLLDLFHTVANAYMQHFIKLSTEKTINEHVQSKAYLVIINRFAIMQKAVSQALDSFHGGRFNSYFNYNIYNEKKLSGPAKVFDDAGVEKEAEPLLRSIAKIYKNVS